MPLRPRHHRSGAPGHLLQVAGHRFYGARLLPEERHEDAQHPMRARGERSRQE